MAKTENDLDIYYAVGNANTSRKETEIAEIIKNEIRWDGNQSLPVLLWLIRLINSLICISFGKNNMSKGKEKFNVTQGMTLLLLKKLSLPANVVFLMILFITNPANKIGYEDEQAEKNLP